MHFKTKRIKQGFSNMKKLVWAKLKPPFSGTGKSPKERADSLSNKLNVNEEYKEAFRTKSYVELWTKVHDQLRKTSIDGPDEVTSPSSSVPFYAHDLSEHLFGPQQQQSLRETIESFKFHHLLVDYFESSFEASRICDLLLHRIEQTRANYTNIRKVIKLSERVDDNSANYTDKIYGAIFSQLAAYALLENPLSIFDRSVKFHDFHDSNMELLHGLTSERGKSRRKARFRRICMKVGGCCLVISHTALLIALLVIAMHGMVGILAAPAIVGCSFCVLRKQIKLVHGGLKTTLPEKRLSAQLDLAAKGTYILINDFDTLSRLVRRLFDEVEHRKALADMCVRTKKIELLKEVLKEFHIHHSYYMEQLEELERHIYLCFHTINRSRRLVTEEIMAAADNSTTENQRNF